MTTSKIIKKSILIALGLALALVMGSADLLYAQDVVSMPDLDRDSSRLTITAQYTDEDITTPISGMEFTVYKVADIEVKDGKVKYTPTEEFKSVDISYKDLTASTSIIAAQKLYEFLGSENIDITGQKAVSNGEGKADFGDVANGMYLVVNTGATGKALNYTRINPYLIAAPLPTVIDGADAWDYDVTSIPKTVAGTFEEPTEPTEGSTTKGVKDETENMTEVTKQVKGSGVNTGDAIRLVLLALVMIGALVIIVVVMKRRRAKE